MEKSKVTQVYVPCMVGYGWVRSRTRTGEVYAIHAAATLQGKTGKKMQVSSTDYLEYRRGTDSRPQSGSRLGWRSGADGGKGSTGSLEGIK